MVIFYSVCKNAVLMRRAYASCPRTSGESREACGIESHLTTFILRSPIVGIILRNICLRTLFK